jgi:UDPglucose 6-dehydrogenase
MFSVGIIGYGFVGKALGQIAIKDQIKVIPFDINNEKFNSAEQMLAAYACDFVFVCVPTPSGEDGLLDISIVFDVIEKWKELNQDPASILVVKSTVPPGFTDEIVEHFGTKRVVFCPEFLTERTANDDFLMCDEIIAGGPDEDCCNEVLALLKIFYESGNAADYKRVYINTDAKSAELIKMARNAYYAMKVSFMNELADLCSAMNINYENFRSSFVHQGRNAWVDPQHTLVPGPDGKRGFGGKCFPKDTLSLISLAENNGVEMPILRAAHLSNKNRRPEEYV